MFHHDTHYRVIYGDTDTMGIAYNANYLRWFEMGRNEFFRALGLPYKEVEEKGFYLPVSEALCKYLRPIRYDDLITIRTRLDPKVRAGVKFDYELFRQENVNPVAMGHTIHAYMNKKGKVVRPPQFIRDLIESKQHPSS